MEKNNNFIKTQVFNLVILDKSGSMESIRKEAIDGYNETLGAIRAAQLKHMDTQDHYVSLAAFCDCGIDMIYDKTPIKEAEKLTKKQYEPCCFTPLFDAIGKTVEECKEDGWMFSFIGAGEDVVEVASTISISNTVVWEQTTEGTREMFENENAAQSRFYDKMAAPCCAGASLDERKRMRKQFSEEYYDKSKK